MKSSAITATTTYIFPELRNLSAISTDVSCANKNDEKNSKVKRAKIFFIR